MNNISTHISTHIIVISHNFYDCMYPRFITVCVIIFNTLNEYYFK